MAHDNFPGPGHYQIDRIFEEPNRKTRDFSAIYEKYKNKEHDLVYLSQKKKPTLAKIAVFAHGCNKEEHTLYGMCLDGKCCLRVPYEDVILRTNSLVRLSGFEAVQRMGKKPAAFKEEIEYTNNVLDLVADPIYEMTALYTAAFKGDIATIHKLSELGINPNIRSRLNGYTALHAAAFRSKKESIFQLLDSFRGKLLVETQDDAGDTALHIASRIGHKEICSAICEEDTCDPANYKNLKNETPLEIARSHTVFQIIKTCIDRNILRNELKELRKMNSTIKFSNYNKVS